MPTATASGPDSGTPSKNGKVVMVRPFRAGVQEVDDSPYDQTFTLKSSTQNVTPQYDIPSTGFLNAVTILVEATSTTNAATVAFAADGPWNVFDQIQFKDVGNQPVIGPITGYDLYLINKFGGYLFQDDPKASPVYSAVSGSGASAGSFSFVLRLPIQIVPRDALGSLGNKSASTPFKVVASLSALSTIYSTAPTNAPTVRIRMAPESYWEPQSTDLNGNRLAENPPGKNTTQFWSVTEYTVASGAFTQQLTSSVGFPIRNLFFCLRDSTDSRSQGESDFPDPFNLKLEANVITDRMKKVWQDQVAKWYGYSASIGDNVNAKDNGFYPLPYCRDFTGKPGWETRRGYLPTSDGMRFEAKGTITGSGVHKLLVYTNYIAPGPGVTLASITA